MNTFPTKEKKELILHLIFLFIVSLYYLIPYFLVGEFITDKFEILEKEIVSDHVIGKFLGGNLDSVNIFLAGGELDQIMDMDHDIGVWAKSHGCTGGIMTGRLGWKKPLTENGWTLQHVHFHKDIKDG